ncbi:MAG: flagellar hook protein FlgE [Dehalococcoidia bacterium]
MMRALFSAISGMKNHMSYMDVVGNNIANVNTTAFKSSRVTFQDILGQTVKGASTPQGGRGGTNPAQIGLGMNLGGIDSLMTQGSLQSTGKLTDFAIQGEGFFILSDGSRQFYSRAGAFDIGVDGGLVSPVTGLRVMGWLSDGTNPVDTQAPIQPIEIPFGTRISAVPTSLMLMAGNLDAGLPLYAAGPPEVGVVSTTVTAYDSLGNLHTIKVDFQHTASNTWDVVAWFDDDDADDLMNNAVTVTNGTLQFLPDGTLDTGVPNNGIVQFSLASLGTGGTDPLVFEFNLEAVSQFAGSSQVSVSRQDGFPAGALVSFAVSPTGEIAGIYSNGSNRVIGQLALASFVNAGGLQRAGQNLWEPTGNSGDPLIGLPNTNGRGAVQTGTLEASNVDLSQQFTSMIVAQRGFQASARVTSAADQMLQDLVNLIR